MAKGVVRADGRPAFGIGFCSNLGRRFHVLCHIGADAEGERITEFASDIRGCRMGNNKRFLQFRNGRHQTLGYTGAVQPHQHVYLVLIDQFSSRLNGDGGLALTVFDRQLEITAEDAATVVDFTDGKVDPALGKLAISGGTA